MGNCHNEHTKKALVHILQELTSLQKKDMSTLELFPILVRECWNIFENIWAMRNDILHHKDRVGAHMSDEQLSEELLDFKYNVEESCTIKIGETTRCQHARRDERNQKMFKIVMFDSQESRVNVCVYK